MHVMEPVPGRSALDMMPGLGKDKSDPLYQWQTPSSLHTTVKKEARFLLLYIASFHTETSPGPTASCPL